MRFRNLLIFLPLTACGPSESAEKCRYAEIQGTCVLVEATDFDVAHGSPGRIRVRYRLIQSDSRELGNHVVLVAAADLDHHQEALDYFNDRNSVSCVVGVRSQGATCPELMVTMALPEPKRELKLSYTAQVVADRRARPGHEEPYGSGDSSPWP